MFENNIGINAEKIISISKQIKSGIKIENPKIELKREFWDISKEEGKNEFAKDLTNMANSPYGSGNIIVGIDDETGDLFNTTLPSDPAKLADIINRKVLEFFTVEFIEVQIGEINIIVIHIPHSYNKPHMLRSYKGREMFIPMRKGTRTIAADKYDLDLMYTEREKIVIPPYRLEPFIGREELLISPSSIQGLLTWNCIINILNTGSRINLVTGGNLTLYDAEDKEFERLELSHYFVPTVTETWEYINSEKYLKIAPNDAIRVNLAFRFKNPDLHIIHGDFIKQYSAQINFYDVTGNVSYTKTVKIVEE